MISSNLRNDILKSLPANIAEEIISLGEFTHYDSRDTLSDPNVPIRSVVFPESGVISVSLRMDADELNEVYTVGSEGMLGLCVAMGVEATQEVVYCQVSGTAWVVPVESFHTILSKYEEVRQICGRYSVVLLDRISRNAACSRTHDVSRRCARWLLQTHDRCHQNEFVLTQEFLATMLNVSRTSVNIAAGALAKENVISYVRGKVKVLNREGLENASCSCYASVREFAAKTMKS